MLCQPHTEPECAYMEGSRPSCWTLEPVPILSVNRMFTTARCVLRHPPPSSGVHNVEWDHTEVTRTGTNSTVNPKQKQTYEVTFEVAPAKVTPLLGLQVEFFYLQGHVDATCPYMYILAETEMEMDYGDALARLMHSQESGIAASGKTASFHLVL